MPEVNFPIDKGLFTETALIPVEGTAASTNDTALMYFQDHDVLIFRVDIVPSEAITANGTNFFTLTFTDGTTTVGTRAWSATNSVQYTKEQIADRRTNPLKLTKGTVLRANRTVGGTGLASPNILVAIQYAVVGPNWQ